jgi:hypothetical protein
MKRRTFLGTWAGITLLPLLGSIGLFPNEAQAFGDQGAFHPRILLTGTASWTGTRRTAPGRWSWELASRTSAPARLVPQTVRADSQALLAEPFVVWVGQGPISPLTAREIEGLRRFISIGGIIFVDDTAPETGVFGKAARREMSRVLPHAVVMQLPTNHVIYHSFYLLKRPVGRVEGPAHLDTIMRGGTAQVLFSSHDLMGALAKDASGTPAFAAVPGGDRQRELASRLAVNIAMYVLCSTYKDDQVHAPFLMRRRAANP